MSEFVHHPAGRQLWSLVESAMVGRSRRGRIEVDGGWGAVEPSDQDAPVPEVLHRMTLGPVALENVSALHDDWVGWRSRIAPLTVWPRVKSVLDEIGGYVVPSLADHGGGPPLLSLTPIAPFAAFRMPVMTGVTGFRVVAGAYRYAGADGPVLRCAGLAYEAVLHRDEPNLVVDALLADRTTLKEVAAASGVAEPMVEDVIAYLAAAGLVTFRDAVGS